MLSHFSHVQLYVILQTVTHQAPLFMRFSRQEYWSGLPCPPPGDLPDPGIKSKSLMCLLHFRQILYCWAIREAQNMLRSGQVGNSMYWSALPSSSLLQPLLFLQPCKTNLISTQQWANHWPKEADICPRPQRKQESAGIKPKALVSDCQRSDPGSAG